MMDAFRQAAPLWVVAMLLAAGGCRRAPEAPAAPQAGQLSDLEKKVLLNVDALAKLKGPAPVVEFVRELKAEGLRAKLETGLDAQSLPRFQALVAKYASKPGFREAVEAPEKQPGGTLPSDCKDPSATPKNDPKPVLDPSAPADGCTDNSGAALPIPVQN